MKDSKENWKAPALSLIHIFVGKGELLEILLALDGRDVKLLKLFLIESAVHGGKTGQLLFDEIKLFLLHVHCIFPPVTASAPAASAFRFMAVSYTHLDVYKRQV